jgi:hypothetical protein
MVLNGSMHTDSPWLVMMMMMMMMMMIDCLKWIVFTVNEWLVGVWLMQA